MSTLLHSLVDGVAASSLPVADRGLHYGDGVFRTMLCWGAQIQQLESQLDKLCSDAAQIGLAPPAHATLKQESQALVAQFPEAVFKWILTAGDSQRGYARSAELCCRRILLVSELPVWPQRYWQPGVKVTQLNYALSGQEQAIGTKSLNRLEQVLARRLLPEDCQEGLLTDQKGRIISGLMSNLFWYRNGVWTTPPIDHAGIAGLTRQRILQLAPQQGLRVQQQHCQANEVARSCEAAFLCNSLIGIWPIAAWDQRRFDYTPEDHFGLHRLRRALSHPAVAKEKL